MQSSDFHLHPDAPERLDALRQVVDIARRESADALLIPGDLFDTNDAATHLRPDVRTFLESFDGETVIIPGNHDLTAFPPEADYGRRTTVLARAPYEEHALRTEAGDEVVVIGAPYQGGTTLAQVLAGIEVVHPAATVLLAHGTYIGGWTLADEGDEDAYLPIRVDDLAGRFVYAAIGHVHARPTFDDWSADRAWGYAGSPIAITRGERGPRHAVLVDLDPGAGVRDVRTLRLDTSYWEEIEVALPPWETASDAVRNVTAALEAASGEPDRGRGLLARVHGWTDGSETDLRHDLERLLGRFETAHRVVELQLGVRTIRTFLDERPELEDILARVRRLGAEEAEDEEVIRRAAAHVIEAAAEVGG
ncbi:MAG: metallophosphoesterase family protein [Planctomycetota bacterium]